MSGVEKTEKTGKKIAPKVPMGDCIFMQILFVSELSGADKDVCRNDPFWSGFPIFLLSYAYEWDSF